MKKKKGSKMTKKKRTEVKRNGKKKEKKRDLHMCQVSHRQLLLGAPELVSV